MSAALQRSLSSLAVPNYRRYFAGQVVSVSGNWMQIVAEMWLIVQLTGSGVSVGVTAGLQFLPMLLLGAWGGLLADRFPKRRLLMITQALMAIPAATLWALTVGGSVEVWMVYALVLARGLVLAVDNPIRQSLPIELVGPSRVLNAVALNSVVISAARIVGPAAAGAAIALLGVGACFGLNALTFAVMLVALVRIDPKTMHAAPAAERGSRDLRDSMRHIRRSPALWIPLAMMAVIGTVSFNFQVLLPLLASETWHGSASTYAMLTIAMGSGSVIGALAAGARGGVSPRLLVGAAAGFGVFELLAAAAPVLPLQLVALALLGAAAVTFSSGVNSALQLAVAPAMRGRVMAVYSMVFLGTTPIGAPVVGWIAEVLSPRAGLAIGAVAALLAAAVATMLFRRAGTWAALPEPEMVRARRRRTVGGLGARVAAAAPQRAGSGAPS